MEPKPSASTQTEQAISEAPKIQAEQSDQPQAQAPIDTQALSSGPADFPLPLEQSGEKFKVLKRLSTLLAAQKGIDETEAKKLRKQIEALGPLETSADPDRTIVKKSEKLRTRIHKQVEKREKDYEAACLLMDELEAAVKQNELHDAETKEKKLIALVAQIPGLSEQRTNGLEKRLRRARPKLNALESWRHWGTMKAREDLIAQVKQLKGSRLNPEKLAKTIRQARDQWREWDKSGDHSNKSLWKEFNSACEVAYEPCIAHFDKLKASRQENLDQANKLIQALDAYYQKIDWKSPDWKAIDKHLRSQRRDFFKIGNVDFKHRKRLRKQLDDLIETFEKHLGRERQRCLKTREKLIAEAEALAEVTDLREATNQLDQIRKQWVPTVLEKRGVENALWKRFQSAGDAVYARRDEHRKAQFAERDEHLRQKSALLEELVTLSQADAKTLLNQPSKLAQIKDQWAAIGEVPRKAEKNLQNQWQTAQKQYRAALKAAQAKAKNAQLEQLVTKAQLCSQLEQAQLASDAAKADEVNAAWGTIDALSDPQQEQAIQARFKAARQTNETQLKANQTQLEEACLKLELILDLDSPAEFAKQRMAYQIERLSASMKKDAQGQDAPESLALILLTTGAVSASNLPTLQKRIDQCLSALSA